jgi:transcriptional regulator with XRE-family HTH domain
MEKSTFTREYKVFLRILRETRRGANVTQIELARRLGLTQSSVSKFERGEARIDIVQLRRICHCLGTSLMVFVQHLEESLGNQREYVVGGRLGRVKKQK